jgi:hypothetical protein
MQTLEMPETPGETATLRRLASLPDLDSVVFLRKENRAFVTGRGPLAARTPPALRALFRYGALGLAILGMVLALVAAGMELYLRSRTPPAHVSLGWILGAANSLFVAAVFGGIVRLQNRRAATERRLAEDGGLIGGELLSVRYRSGGEGQPSLKVHYSFLRPGGQQMSRRQTLFRFDVDRRALPPAGSKILVLYVDENLFDVL